MSGGVDIVSLNQKHRSAIRLHILGLTVEEIETQLGFCDGYVSQILRSPLAQAKIAELTAEQDSKAVEALAEAREIVVARSSELAERMVSLGLSAKKEETQLSGCIQALKFAESGVLTDAAPQAAVKIYLRDKDGNVVETDIFSGAYQKDAGEVGDPVAGAEQSQKALDLMEGKVNDAENSAE